MKNSIVFAFTFLSLLISASANEGLSKRDKILTYLEHVGAINVIDLQVDATQQQFMDYHDTLPLSTWEDPRIIDAFDNLKIAYLQNSVTVLEAELTDDELDFLVAFYQSEDGQRVVQLSRRLDPIMIAAGDIATREFTAEFEAALMELAE